MRKKTFVRKAKKFAVNIVDNPALILMYHRVAELERDPFELAVSPDNFYKQIEYLKATYNVIDPDDLVRIRKSGKSLLKKSIIITFDDGCLDNYTNATPVLEHFDAGTIFFIATANIGRKNDFWSDSLGRVLYETEALHATCRSPTEPARPSRRIPGNPPVACGTRDRPGCSTAG